MVPPGRIPGGTLGPVQTQSMRRSSRATARFRGLGGWFLGCVRRVGRNAPGIFPASARVYGLISAIQSNLISPVDKE